MASVGFVALFSWNTRTPSRIRPGCRGLAEDVIVLPNSKVEAFDLAHGSGPSIARDNLVRVYAASVRPGDDLRGSRWANKTIMRFLAKNTTCLSLII